MFEVVVLFAEIYIINSQIESGREINKFPHRDRRYRNE